MKLLGITGGVGMGKSTSARLLHERGVPVVDTDQLARELVEKGQPALAQIRARFGPQVIGADGRLRRGELARIVFADDTSRRELEGILHPPIRERWMAQAEQWREEGKSLAAVVIPLLYETAAERQFDAVACVACSAASQRERLRARGWDDEQIRERIAAQMPVERKLALADFVVWTEGEVASHAAQLECVRANFASGG
jgi:dephospho-CoA kinase